MRFGIMGTTSPGLDREEQVDLPLWPTRPKDTAQEAHNRGDLKDNYRSNHVNRASRERVQVKYNDN
jgi:hypothetical protein